MRDRNHFVKALFFWCTPAWNCLSQLLTTNSSRAAEEDLTLIDPVFVEAARRQLREKAELRRAELDAAERHLERLREGRPESLETTSLHLDILADRSAELLREMLSPFSVGAFAILRLAHHRSHR